MPVTKTKHKGLDAIVLSSAELALRSCELDPASDFAALLEYIDIGAIVVFTVEMVAKVLSLGLIFTPRAYHWCGGWQTLFTHALPC